MNSVQSHLLKLEALIKRAEKGERPEKKLGEYRNQGIIGGYQNRGV